MDSNDISHQHIVYITETLARAKRATDKCSLLRLRKGCLVIRDGCLQISGFGLLCREGENIPNILHGEINSGTNKNHSVSTVIVLPGNTSGDLHKRLKVDALLLRTAAPVLLSVMEHGLSLMVPGSHIPPSPTRSNPPRSHSDHTTCDIPHADTAPFHLRVTSPSPLPFIGFGCDFSDSIFSSDLTAVGAFGFCELYSSIDLICGAAGAAAGAAADAAGAAAALTALLMAATVGEGANAWLFGSQLWGPTVQPGILLNSSQSYTRLRSTKRGERTSGSTTSPWSCRGTREATRGSGRPSGCCPPVCTTGSSRSSCSGPCRCGPPPASWDAREALL